jgi:hypothetical protein
VPTAVSRVAMAAALLLTLLSSPELPSAQAVDVPALRQKVDSSLTAGGRAGSNSSGRRQWGIPVPLPLTGAPTRPRVKCLRSSGNLTRIPALNSIKDR